MRSEERHDWLNQGTDNAEGTDHRVRRLFGIKLQIVLLEKSYFNADDYKWRHCQGNRRPHEDLVKSEPEVLVARLEIAPRLFVVSSDNLKLSCSLKNSTFSILRIKETYHHSGWGQSQPSNDHEEAMDLDQIVLTGSFQKGDTG